MDNVILFISINTMKDGAEKSLVALNTYLNYRGIATCVVIPRAGNIEDLLRKQKIQYIIHPFQGNVNAGRGIKLFRGLAKAGINYIEAYRLISRLKVKGMKVTGVHSNTITTDFGYYVAKLLHIPHIWHIREFGKLDFNFDFELGIRYIYHCTRSAARIICNSEAVKSYYMQYFEPDKLICVHNGVPSKQSKENEWETELFKLVLIGRLSEEKGQKQAIDACKLLLDQGYDNFRLDLYGDGIEKNELATYILHKNLNNHVFLMGYSNDVPISSYHVGLMCSPFEAFGRVTVEYMMNSIPVIGVNAGATPEIIGQHCGILYQSGDIASLCLAIRTLYSDRARCKKMGNEGRVRAISMFNEELYCENVLKQYKQIFIL